MKSSVVLFGCFLGWVSATVAWADLPSCITPPKNQTNVQGGTVTFCVEATGTPPLAYQWRDYISGTVFTDIPGATNSCLVLTNVQPTTHRFGVVISNAVGAVTCPPARLEVVLSIHSGPEEGVADIGGNITFSVMADSDIPVSYQWLKEGALIEGATASALNLSSLTIDDRGAFSVVISNVYSEIYGTVTSPPVTLTLFATITEGPGATDEEFGGGVAWADLNNDGWVDLLESNWGTLADQSPPASNHVYLNDQAGSFTRLTGPEAGDLTSEAHYSVESSAADFDNDGFMDLFVAGWSTSVIPEESRNFLYRNNGDMTFSKVLDAGPPVTDEKQTPCGIWGDYDLDGYVDLFTSDGVLGGNNSLHRNNGDGTFSRVDEDVFDENFNSRWPAWGDYDNDGDLDLVVACITQKPFYQNNGDGTFSKITDNAISQTAGSAVCPTWGDYDNDGWLDLFLTMWSRSSTGNYLFHNERNGTFTAIPMGGIGPNIGGEWVDYDNDGDLDLYVTRSGEHRPGHDTNLLYRNNGDGSFTQIQGLRMVTEAAWSEVAAWADYDNNGFLDLVVNNYGDPNSLFQNLGNGNRWMFIKLVGSLSNRAAIGAKVRLLAAIKGNTVWQMREISGGGAGQNDPRAHFGLGDAALANTVRIEWPSGTVQELQDVAANQILTVIEPPRLATDAPGSIQLRGGKGMVYTLQSSPTMETETWSDLVTLTNTTGTATYLDPDAGVLQQRFYRAVQND